MTSVVVVTRRRHPLEGQSLRELGRMRRHGRLELLLVLPDGSKSLIPAAWTDLDRAAEHAPTPTRSWRRWARWRTCLPGAWWWPT